MYINNKFSGDQRQEERWNAFRDVLSSSRQGPPLRQIPREGNLQVSFAQQRFWLLNQLEPESSAYNESVAFFRLKGSLNIVALKQSLNEIRRRHEVLRTTFLIVDGKPIQRISPYTPIELPIIDLREFPLEQREAEAQRQANEEVQQLFDLERGPLLRVKLLHLNKGEYIFLTTIHHIVYDGWSHGVFIQELSKLYTAFCNNKPSLRDATRKPLPELPIQYADFAQWQRDRLQGKILQSQIDYWKQQLSGNLPVLHLPTDRLQPPIQTYGGAYYSQVLPKELIEALKSLSESEDATLFMVLLAAFKTLLYRYTGQEDILVGSPIANRNRFEISELIGCFVNTLVLRTDLSLNPTFRELLGRVREVALGAFAHQDLPFEKLVEELQPERNMSHSPFFQVMFVLHNTPAPSLKLDGLTLSPLPIENKTPKFNLTLSLEETAQGLMGVWEYNTDLFDASTIERMAGHFQTLLEGIVTDPQQRLGELPLLTQAEQHQLLVEWNNTQTKYQSAQCIHQLFEAQAERTPFVVAVVFEDSVLTYQELNTRANKIAHYLQAIGVGPEVLVGLCVDRSLEMVVALLAILKAGGAYVPLEPQLPQERLAYILSDSQVSVLLTQEKLVNRLPDTDVRVVCLDTDWSIIAQESEENPVSNVKPENLAYIIYTSGSTGNPKGVLITHQNVVRLFAATQSWFSFNEGDIWTFFHSYAFDFSVWEIWGALLYGGRLIVVPYWISRSPESFYHLLCKEKVTVLNQTPSAFRQLMQADKSLHQNANLSLRLVIFGGEALDLQSLKPWFERHGDRSPQLVNMYGITETTVHVTYRPLTIADLNIRGSMIGSPIPDLQVYILDQNLQPTPIGIPGEIHIGGAGLARGYLNRPDLTNSKFISNPFSHQEQARLYKTGDLGRYCRDRNIEYLGRIDHQVKIRGFRIELGEIEVVLNQHSGVRETVVMANSDVADDTRLVAYIVSNQEIAPTINELRQFLKDKLPEYMVPSAFVMLSALPLTPNGKVDRKALPAPDGKLNCQDNFVLPRTPKQEAIAQIFTNVLRLQQISIYDNFFEIGGHSLLATQVISRLREAFNVDLPLRRLFEAPTIAQLEKILLEFEPNEAELISINDDWEKIAQTLEPHRTSNEFPLSFTQERLWFLDQLEGETSNYNIAMVFKIQGKLNIAILEKALATMIQRHEILRTRFITANGTPVQVIDSNINLTLPIVDLQKFPQDERYEQVQEKVKEELETPFNLSKSPLVRVTLLQVASQGFVLLVSMHHIVSDGWSVTIFIQELFTLYQAFLSNSPSPLPSLPIQYADFAVWQRQWWSEERLKTQLNYWKQQLSDTPPILEIPSDRPRPPVQTFRGKSLSFRLNQELKQQLQTLSKNTGATLFMTLIAAFATLLYRYSGQEDISIGSPIANRNRSEIEPLIGSFVNTLVLRISIKDNPSFAKLLTQVRQVALDAYEHQDAPFEKVVEELQPQRNLSYNPLFQVMFVLQNTPIDQLEVPDLSLTPLALEAVNTNFDITLSMEEKEGGLTGIWEYSSDLFNQETIARMADSFQVLLEAITKNSQQPIEQLPLLTNSQRHQLLLEWNNTVIDYPINKTIPQVFEEQVQKTPNATALVFGQQQLTYEQLNCRANKIAHYLQSLGVEKEVLVGICLERSVEMVVGLLAILKAGGAYVPLDPNYPQERLSYMLEDASVSVLLTQKQLMKSLPPHQAKIVCLDTAGEFISTQTQENPVSGVSATNLAYVIYTSGSTGKPKGVMIEHRGVINLANWQADNFQVTEQSSIAQFFSYSFDGAVGETFMALLNGATLFMLDRTNWSPEKIIESINSHQITHIVLVPSVIKQLNLENIKKSNSVSIVSVGEKCPIDLAQKWAKTSKFMNAYGPTEYTVYSHLYQTPQAQPESLRIVPIGKAIHNTKTYILDFSLNPVPVGVLGEIYISGVGIARGYLNQGQKTLEKFIPNQFYLADKFEQHGLVTIQSSLREIYDLKNGTETKNLEPNYNQIVFTDISVKEVLKLIKELDIDLIVTTFRFLEKYQNNYIVYSSFCRYLLEGYHKIYHSCGINQDVLRFLFQGKDLSGIKVIDFGFGNAEIIKNLAEAGSHVIGLDINPFFVYQARKQGLDARMVKIDVEPTKFLEECGVAECSQDFAISTLTLDRVSSPNNLLINIFSTLKPGGSFSIQTLLPIIPIEDGEVENPLIYTDIQNQITPGKSVEEDKLYLISLLYELGARNLNICEIPYIVKSRDGIQDYTVWCFFGNKASNQSAELANNYYARMYKTGDLARYLPDGNIEFIDRIDNQVKIRGFRIELEEIEAILITHPQIKEAVVIAKDEFNNKSLVGYIVPHSTLSSSQIRNFLKQKLPEYMIPNAFVMLEAMPLTPNGKIDHRALPAPDSSCFNLEASFVPPRNTLEVQLTQIWAELLNVRSVGVEDNFFDKGGHSLLAVRLMIQIQQQFGKNLQLSTLFQNPTIEQLAHLISPESDSLPLSALVPIQPSGSKRPLFCVHPVGGNVLCYMDLANCLGREQPFYGLQSLALDEKHQPHTQVEEMASHYIEMIQTVQPQGPYILAGWSFGGLVAYEMAQQLQKQEQQVSILALIDTYPPSLLAKELHNQEGQDNTALFIDLLADDIFLSREYLQQLEPDERLAFVIEQAKQVNLIPENFELLQVNSLLKVYQLNRQAAQDYIPQPYQGRLILFQASDNEQHLAKEWQTLVKHVDNYLVSGNHYTMLQRSHIEMLVEKLVNYFE